MISTSFFGVLTKVRVVTSLQHRTFRSFNSILNMNTIYFRHQCEDKKFEINFRYVNEGFRIDKNFNFLRSETERVEDCLRRIGFNVEKEFGKKTKKNKKKPKKTKETDEEQPNNDKQQDSNSVIRRHSVNHTVTTLYPHRLLTNFIFLFQVSVKMVRNGITLGEETLLEISSSTDDLELHILDEPFVVTFNEPFIESIKLPSSMLVGCYVYPSTIEMQCGNPDETKFEWYKSKQVNFCVVVVVHKNQNQSN